ncbi:MAG: hypothetical protein OXG72_13150 [Acidobacteria bacterium]|nr:hypothetical protein [Acidobacteriota bacterium]
MSTGRSGRHGFVLPIAAAMLAGVAVGLAIPRPFESASAAQQPPSTVGGAAADDATAAGEIETQPGPPIATRRFEAPAALIVSFVRPASAGSFETLSQRLVSGLAASDNPQRRSQAAGWTMYRVVEESGPNNNAVFLWFLDPTVANANYAVPQLLNEMFPAEVQQLYEGYVQSFGVGQMVLNLEPVVLVEEPR